MKPEELCKGIAKAIYMAEGSGPDRWQCETKTIRDSYLEQADTVIACPEVQQLYVQIWDESHKREFVKLADWLKEAKP